MKKSLYLDFSLPVFVEKDLLDRYISFLKTSIKLLEKNTNIRYYISVNLFTEIHLNSSFEELSKILKHLVDTERAEVVLSSSFGLNDLATRNMHSSDILFSEYFSSYHFGMPRDFEGDDCMMMKNIHTFYLPKGGCSLELVNSLKELGLRRLFVSQIGDEKFLKYHNIHLIPVNNGLRGLFRNFITLDAVSDFFKSENSNIYQLNLFEIFNDNRINIETNFSNFIYLLDKSSENWAFLDIDDENIVYKNINETEITSLLGDKALLVEDREKSLLSIKNQIIDFLIMQPLNPLDLDIEDFRRIAVWRKSGNSIIDGQNMFNLSLLTLLSSQVTRRETLLNLELLNHINDIIDGIVVSELCSDGLNTLILKFKQEINLK